MDSRIELYETTGAAGAAKAAGVGIGAYAGLEEAMKQAAIVNAFEPLPEKELYQEAYARWEGELNARL